MQKLRNIIVTGCNKGIGFGIVKKLAERNDWNIIMACRNLELAEKSKLQIQSLYPNANLHIQQLDVSDTKSIDSFIPKIKQKYHSIDVLVNNAGVAAKGDAFDAQVFEYTFGTNFYGTIQFTEKMLPLISVKGKIVTLGSMAGKMSYDRIKSEQLKNRFKNQKITKQQLFGLINEFKTGVIQNNFEEKGFPKWIYGISKLGINIYTSIFSKTKEVLEKQVQVYVCCPGYVATDMTNHKGVLTIDQGILTPMYLVDLPFQLNKELQGGFFQVSALSSTF